MLETNEADLPLARLFDRLASIGRAMQRVRRSTTASGEGYQAQNSKAKTEVIPQYLGYVDVFAGTGSICNSRQGQDTIEQRGYLTSASEVGKKGQVRGKPSAKKRKLSERGQKQSMVGIGHDKNGSKRGSENLLLTKIKPAGA